MAIPFTPVATTAWASAKRRASITCVHWLHPNRQIREYAPRYQESTVDFVQPSQDAREFGPDFTGDGGRPGSVPTIREFIRSAALLKSELLPQESHRKSVPKEQSPLLLIALARLAKTCDHAGNIPSHNDRL